jgi:hypothetical protein
MIRQQQPGNDDQKGPRQPIRARHAKTKKTHLPRNSWPSRSRLMRWLAGVTAAVIAALSPHWFPTILGAAESLFSNTGPALTVAAEPTFLDDQGYTIATPDGLRPGPQLLHLMTQTGAASSGRFLAGVRAIGGVNVNVLSVRLIVNGDSRQGVRVIDIRPALLHRTAPLDGTLFLIPSQAGNATIKMMFDLDEAIPVARTIANPPCRLVMRGDIEYCVPVLRNWPYPVERFPATVGGELSPGSQFFNNETIHLSDGEQQVLYIRAQAAHCYATFDLEIDYIIGRDTADVHKLIVSDHGHPFRVTGMQAGAKPNTVSYQEAFNLQGNFSLCAVANPSLIPMGINEDKIECRH